MVKTSTSYVFSFDDPLPNAESDGILCSFVKFSACAGHLGTDVMLLPYLECSVVFLLLNVLLILVHSGGVVEVTAALLVLMVHTTCAIDGNAFPC